MNGNVNAPEWEFL